MDSPAPEASAETAPYSCELANEYQVLANEYHLQALLSRRSVSEDLECLWDEVVDGDELAPLFFSLAVGAFLLWRARRAFRGLPEATQEVLVAEGALHHSKARRLVAQVEGALPRLARWALGSALLAPGLLLAGLVGATWAWACLPLLATVLVLGGPSGVVGAPRLTLWARQAWGAPAPSQGAASARRRLRARVAHVAGRALALWALTVRVVALVLVGGPYLTAVAAALVGCAAGLATYRAGKYLA